MRVQGKVITCSRSVILSRVSTRPSWALMTELLGASVAEVGAVVLYVLAVIFFLRGIALVEGA